MGVATQFAAEGPWGGSALTEHRALSQHHFRSQRRCNAILQREAAIAKVTIEKAKLQLENQVLRQCLASWDNWWNGVAPVYTDCFDHHSFGWHEGKPAHSICCADLNSDDVWMLLKDMIVDSSLVANKAEVVKVLPPDDVEQLEEMEGESLLNKMHAKRRTGEILVSQVTNN